MSSRRYIKRIYRVPKDRGPVEMLATLVVKSLVKHGWPAEWQLFTDDDWGFLISCKDHEKPPDDFASASAIAVRIAARTYNIEISECLGYVRFEKPYIVAPGGHFKEVKP